MNSTAVRSWFAGVLSLGIVIGAIVTNNALVRQPAPVLRAILETSVAIIGTLVAILGFGRFRRTGNLGDLAVVCAVALLAWVHTLFGSVPDLISPDSVGNGISERYEVWGTLVVRLMAAGFLIASVHVRGSISRSAPVSRLGRYRAFVWSGALGALAIVILSRGVCPSPERSPGADFVARVHFPGVPAPRRIPVPDCLRSCVEPGQGPV